MHIVFWSPIAGQTGTTSSMLAIALAAAYHFEKRVILTQVHPNNRNMEGILLGGKQQENLYCDIGMDALLRLMRTGNKAEVKDFALGIGREGLDILPGIQKGPAEPGEEDLLKHLPFLYRVMDESYEMIFTDAGAGKGKIFEMLIKEADILAVTLNQNKSVIERCLEEYPLPLDKTIFIVGKYCNTSAWDLKRLEKSYRQLKGRLYAIPFYDACLDAISDNKIISFFLKNMALNNRSKGKEYLDAVVKIAGSLAGKQPLREE